MNESNGKKVIVTTSWDDGHPMDIRLAELLRSYNVPGTFYIPLRYQDFPIVTENEVRILRDMEMEIGSHTVSHPRLTEIEKDQAAKEVTDSKKFLEDILGEPVLSFGYPEGKFNPTVCSIAKEAGYRLARATVAFRTELEFNPFCMPVSFQFFPHAFNIHIRHALKERNIRGVFNWCKLWKMESDLVKLSELVFDHVLRHGGVFHIWGHSWEIEKFDLWELLESVLKRIANREGVFYLTNSQVLDLIGR